jgi:monoterpene epsilon-lactone hydrolase
VNTNLEILKDFVRAAASSEPRSLTDERAAMDSYPQPLPEGTLIEPVLAGGVPGEWSRRAGAPRGHAVLFLHGGGYCIGSPRSHRRLAALIGVQAGLDVLSLEYRLAPEHACPAAVDDAVSAYRWLRASGFEEIVLAGDSAGGGLALATLLALRDLAEPLPIGAVLLAPWVDLTLAGDSVANRAEADFILTAKGLHDSAAAYAGAYPLDHPLVSPLLGDLSGLPPLLIQVGDADLLLDDSVRLHARAREAGVDATLDVAPEMPHVYQGFSGLLPEADAALDRIGGWLNRDLSERVQAPS